MPQKTRKRTNNKYTLSKKRRMRTNKSHNRRSNKIKNRISIDVSPWRIDITFIFTNKDKRNIVADRNKYINDSRRNNIFKCKARGIRLLQ